jgi:Fe-S-cluster-containing hydrogenase component 2
MPRKKEATKTDIFQLLLESKNQKGSMRKHLLDELTVKEFFEEGDININHRTCQGIECELCIKACPTKALYWRDGKVGVVRDLCVYCGACVLCCIVDDCVRVTRKRSDGKIENFSKPGEVVQLFCEINSRKRHNRVERLFPDAETYLKRYGKL